MATYVRESTRGKVLHLLKIDNTSDPVIYLDATNRIRDAERDDQKAGYQNGGPAVGIEIEKARAYADYVGQYATVDTLHQYYCTDYYLFTDTGTTGVPIGTRKKTNAGSNVSI